jgi:hypothetical protein
LKESNGSCEDFTQTSEEIVAELECLHDVWDFPQELRNDDIDGQLAKIAARVNALNEIITRFESKVKSYEPDLNRHNCQCWHRAFRSKVKWAIQFKKHEVVKYWNDIAREKSRIAFHNQKLQRLVELSVH